MGLLDGLLGTGEPGIKVGDAAPEFDLTDAAGKRVRLSDFRGKRNVVLYFYPKDDTPGCTKEACSFRDNYQAFTDAGAEVIGVSSDNGASHQKFTEKFHLPFTLVSDTGGERPQALRRPRDAGTAARPRDVRDRPRRHRPPRLQLAAPGHKARRRSPTGSSVRRTSTIERGSLLDGSMPGAARGGWEDLVQWLAELARTPCANDATGAN